MPLWSVNIIRCIFIKHTPTLSLYVPAAENCRLMNYHQQSSPGLSAQEETGALFQS